MISEFRTSQSPLLGVLTALLFSILILLFAGFLATTSVTGSVTLPNGSSVGITTKGLGFGVTSSKNKTRIEADGYVVEVDDKLILRVNGTEVGILDEEPKNYDLVIDSEGLKIIWAEQIIADVK